MNSCNNCPAKTNCPFYEKNADDCVYDLMAQYAQWCGEQMKKEKEKTKK